MYGMTHVLEVLITLLVGASPVFAQTVRASGNDIPEPHEVTYCELSRDPAAYNHALVRLTAFVTHGFEDFQVTEPDLSYATFFRMADVRRQSRVEHSLLLPRRSWP